MNSRVLRRRLLIFSAPVAVLLVLTVVKLASVGIAGRSAAADFAAGNADGLRSAVSALEVVNVIEPAKAHVASGALAVLDDRLQDADHEFSLALALTEPAQSCGVLVDLELVRETLGDRAVQRFDTTAAAIRYVDALRLVDGAPRGCFAGNADPDEQRRALRNDARRRLSDKIAAARTAAPPPPPVSPPAAPPPATPPPPASAPDDRAARLRLDPSAGDPLEKLRQILRDAAAARAAQPGGGS
jgi:hypothetical protein